MTKAEKQLAYEYLAFMVEFAEIGLNEQEIKDLQIIALSESALLDCEPIEETKIIRMIEFIMHSLSNSLIINIDLDGIPPSVANKAFDILFGDNDEIDIKSCLNKVKKMVFYRLDANAIECIADDIIEKASNLKDHLPRYKKIIEE